MADYMGGGTSATRSPLADATRRMNAPLQQVGPKQQILGDANCLPTQSRAKSPFVLYNGGLVSKKQPRRPNFQDLADVAEDPETAAITNASKSAEEYKRDSHTSHNSTSNERNKDGPKTSIGPWIMGKSLGQGTSARVRICRHSITRQVAAVKIIPKRTALLAQAGSILALHEWDTSLPETINGELRMPMAVEREVAILKLIDHPNITKLHDIWESRKEM
jgi:serine/threonine-protein kinase HSL1, negative regulator of Swe1 kinase